MFKKTKKKLEANIFGEYYNGGVCGRGLPDCDDYDGGGMQQIRWGRATCGNSASCSWESQRFEGSYIICDNFLFIFPFRICMGCSGMKKDTFKRMLKERRK